MAPPTCIYTTLVACCRPFLLFHDFVLRHYDAFFMLLAEPHWHPYQSILPANTPRWVKSWLLDPGSLTKRLQQASDHHFSVEVLQQNWQLPSTSERQRLGLDHRHWALVREVCLLCNGKPCVYARTVLPRSSLRGRLSALGRLGTRPLGAALFSEPTLQRQLTDIAAFREIHLPEQAKPSLASIDCDHSDLAWGRRSLFSIESHPLLVSEVFLPSIRQLSSTKAYPLPFKAYNRRPRCRI